MNTIIIAKEGRELGRYQLSKKSLLIGRSPVCDMVLRAAYVAPMHYWLEYIEVQAGANEENKGIWSLTNISDGGSQQKKPELSGDYSGEGVLLGVNRIEYSGLQFEIIEDRLEETDIKRGALKREMDRGLAGEPEQKIKGLASMSTGMEEVLSVTYFRKDLDMIANIIYLNRAKPTKKFRIFPNIKEAFFAWQIKEVKSLGSLVFSNNVDLNEVAIFDRRKKLEPELKNGVYTVPLTAGSFLKVETPNVDYILRFVPKFDVALVEASPFKDPTLRVTLFVILFVVLSGWLAQFATVEEENDKIPKRVATVVIKEQPTKPAPPKQKEPLPPSESKPKDQELAIPAEKQKPINEKPKVEKPAEEKPAEEKSTIEKSNQEKKDSPGAQAGAASAPKIVNSNFNGTKAGLNNTAPITNVNTVGLLGKLKGKKAAGTVSADTILNQGVINESASGETGFVVNKSAAGVITSGKTKPGGLAAASTTLSNAGATDPSASGALAISGGKGKFSYGTGTNGSLGGDGTGDGQSGLGASTGMEVSGGLDKEAIRRAIAENRRALRNCYESAMLTKSKLEGKIILRWQISPQGPVATIRTVSSTLNTPQFEVCIESVVKAIVFPRAPSGQATTVIYPFVFQGKK